MNITILGAGTWGTALARMLSSTGNRVTMWSAVESEIIKLSETRVHPNLPNVTLPENVELTLNIEDACKNSEMILLAVSSVYIRSVAHAAMPFIQKDSIIVNLAKGIEPNTLKSMTEIISDEISCCEHGNVKLVALSGPTHAEEVAMDLPTVIVAASDDINAAQTVQNVFSNNVMRVYTNSDIRGVELCGAMKNIVALAAGMSEGLGYGDNSKAALVTRGMAEITRLGLAMGCDMRTFYGLAGIGDLIVTATSRHSRNNKAGKLLGKGYSLKDCLTEVGMVVEGINAIPAAISLSKRYNVEMPIISAVNDIVNFGSSPLQKVNQLMMRDYKNEN